MTDWSDLLDCLPEKRRRELMRELPALGFLPPRESWTAELSTHRAAIDEFANRFWLLDSGERRVQWQALAESCAGDLPAIGRLRRLKPGLDVEQVSESELSGPAGLIAQAVQDLFTLTPFERARRREEFVRDLVKPIAPWKRAVKKVRSQLPDHAALEPALLQRIAGWRAVKVGVVSPAAPVTSHNGAKPIAWGLILAVMLVVRACASLESSSRSYRAPPNPEHLMPKYKSLSVPGPQPSMPGWDLHPANPDRLSLPRYPAPLKPGERPGSE